MKLTIPQDPPITISCPKCGSIDLELLSQVIFPARLAGVLGNAQIRCLSCGHEFNKAFTEVIEAE